MPAKGAKRTTKTAAKPASSCADRMQAAKDNFQTARECAKRTMQPKVSHFLKQMTEAATEVADTMTKVAATTAGAVAGAIEATVPEVVKQVKKGRPRK